MHDVAFIIVTWNAKDLVLDCLESLYKEVLAFDYEVIVIDNGSADGSVETLRQRFGRARIIANEKNVGFAGANNQGLEVMNSRYAVLLNNDTIVLKGAFDRLLEFMDARPDVGVTGPLLVSPDYSKQNCFHNFPTLITEIFGVSMLRLVFPKKYPGKRRNYTEPIETDSILGACLMTRKEVIEQVGVLDDNYFFFLEETDWCFRMKNKGWKVFHIPDVKIIHIHGASTKKKIPVETWIEYYRSNYRYFKKNKGETARDVVFIVKFVKLIINLILMTMLCGLTLFLKKHYKQKLRTYATLLLWHLKGCPKNSGLKSVK